MLLFDKNRAHCSTDFMVCDHESSPAESGDSRVQMFPSPRGTRITPQTVGRLAFARGWIRNREERAMTRAPLSATRNARGAR